MVRAATDPTDVRRLVAELLDVDPQTLDLDADLIAAGLDSIRMMSLSGRWRREGFDVDFAALAANPTITGWAQLLGAPAAVTPPAEDTHTDDGEDAPFPLAPMQHAMWVGRNDNQELGGVAGHLYVEFDGGRIDADRLRAAADALARRHPMLRVEFLPDGTSASAARL
ncbi:phosphopantetheine-binding protein, partial [Mycolicibacterium insubricum]|uniref:phosphopantetheine-binding protein n=1 Tax=Mycolicibacterium insubricum TaxID=444597 RepID=UPI0027E2270C